MPVSSSAPWPVAQPDTGEIDAESQLRHRRDDDEVPAAPSIGPKAAALSPPEKAPLQPTETAVRSRSAAGDCNQGKRVISAYYWVGQRTASGERFDPQGMTAAHRTLPFGTRLSVSNPRTGRSVTVVINDRGPFVSGIGLDLSLGAAQAIGMRGIGIVCIR